MASRRKAKNVTEVDFRKIKTLLNEGLTTAPIIELTGRGSATISVIRNSATFGEYKQNTRRSTNIASQPIVTNHQANNLETILNELDGLLDELKDKTAQVITLAVETGVKKEMEKVAVELRELRLLKDAAKTNNWTSNLMRKFQGN